MSAQLQPAECGHGANEMVDALAKEMVAGLMSEFEENEFEFFDRKCLEEAMASDKLGRVKEEAHRIAGYEIEKITSKKFFCSTSQVSTHMIVCGLELGVVAVANAAGSSSTCNRQDNRFAGSGNDSITRYEIYVSTLYHCSLV